MEFINSYLKFSVLQSNKYELVRVKPLFNRSLVPITSTLVAPTFIIEPQDVREYRHSASRDSPTSNLLYNSLLS